MKGIRDEAMCDRTRAFSSSRYVLGRYRFGVMAWVTAPQGSLDTPHGIIKR